MDTEYSPVAQSIFSPYIFVCLCSDPNRKKEENIDNAKLVAGSKIKVKCKVNLAGIDENSANVQVYFGQFLENGSVKNVYTTEMKKVAEEENRKIML